METNDPLTGIDDIDWSSFDHAYGSAADVPPYLRKIQSADEEERQLGWSGLYANIYHQGTRYNATPIAIPFLYKILDFPTTPKKEEFLEYFVMLSLGGLNTGKPLGTGITPWNKRKELEGAEEMPKMTQEELEAAMDDEVAWEAVKQRTSYNRHVWGYQSYRAVQAGLDSIIACLDNESASVRAYAAYALAWFPDEQVKINLAMFRLLDGEQDFAVRATAFVSLSALQAAVGDFSETLLVKRLRAVYSDNQSIEFLRFICSICLVKLRSHTPEQLSLVTRKLIDETYLQDYELPNGMDSEEGKLSKFAGTAFPFMGNKLNKLATMELGSLKGSENPDVARLLITLAFKPGASVWDISTIEAALNVVFEGVEPNIEAGYDSFSLMQQELIESLVKYNNTSGTTSLWYTLRELKLPQSDDELRKFKATSADPSNHMDPEAEVN
ncbi:hypothetical protein BGZ63DRAFT_387664 [Mariannaea sp. PMI_226]|nr:hypothetical protein BGZ63DRAFT_387664 [Mariannaea sp. PMI_226]